VTAREERDRVNNSQGFQAIDRTQALGNANAGYEGDSTTMYRV